MRNTKGRQSPLMERQDTEPCMDPNTFGLLLQSSPSTALLLDSYTPGTFFEEATITGLPSAAPNARSGSVRPATRQVLVQPNSCNASTMEEIITPSVVASALQRVNSSGGYGGASEQVAVNYTLGPSSRPHFVGMPQGVMQIQKQMKVVQSGPVSGAPMYINNQQQQQLAAAPYVAHPGCSSSYTSSSPFDARPHSPATREASEAVEALLPVGTNPSHGLLLSQFSDLPDFSDINDADFSIEPKFSPIKVSSKRETETSADSLPRSDSIDVMQLSDWPGEHNFIINFPSDARNNRKWGYCNEVKRVFCQPGIAIEVQVRVDDWKALEGSDTRVRLCAVFTEAHHRTSPVHRCDHHRVADRKEYNEAVEVDYLIQIDHKNAEYGEVGQRQVVSAALQPSRVGEEFATLLVKCACMTSCVGGPNRRPFAVIFSLMVKGREAGRRVLAIKCCKGVFRDMKAEKSRLQVGGEVEPGDPHPSPAPQSPKTHTVTLNLEPKKRKADKSKSSNSRSSKKVRVSSQLGPSVVPHPTSSEHFYVLIADVYKKRMLDYLDALESRDYLHANHPDACKKYNC